MVAADPELARRVALREASALMGAALVYSGQLSRSRIRGIARRSARLALVRKLRVETEAWEALEFEGTEHLDRALAAERGVIVAPIHLGPYRLIGPALAQAGYDVTWLADAVSSRFFADELTNGRLRGYADACAATIGTPGADTLRRRIHPVDSTELTALWQLRRGLANGHIAVMFPDGNSAMDQRPTDDHCLRVPFLGATIAVRAGIAALAGVARCPVVPAVALARGRRPPVLRFEAPLLRLEGEPKADFRLRVMTALFAHLAGHVRDAPHRWEEWMHLRRWILRSPGPPPAPRPISRRSVNLDRRLRLGRDGLWVIDLEGTPRVMDLESYNSLGTSPMLVSLIRAAERGDTLRSWLVSCPVPADARTQLNDALARGLLGLGASRSTKATGPGSPSPRRGA